MKRLVLGIIVGGLIGLAISVPLDSYTTDAGPSRSFLVWGKYGPYWASVPNLPAYIMLPVYGGAFGLIWAIIQNSRQRVRDEQTAKRKHRH